MSAAAFADRLDGAQPVNLWPTPDMSVLSGGRTAPPVMPGAMFGNGWGLIEDLAEGAGAPVDYVAVGVLGVAASLIGSTRRIKPYAIGQWQEPCILWLAAVGNPSANKSPALDAATAPLNRMEAELAEGYRETLQDYQTTLERATAERKAWQAQVATATKDGVGTPRLPDCAELPDKPARPRLFVQDATPEAMGDVLESNPRGVLHLRDELAGWLSSFDRYSPGGREIWLEAFGGRRHTVDRKGRDRPQLITFNGVSVIGGIQPEKLSASLLSGTDDGLVARFLWAWPDPVPYHRPTRVADTRMLETAYVRLRGLQPEVDGAPVVLRLSDDAADIFEAWARDSQEADQQAGPLFAGFLGKLRGIVLRLSLLSEYLQWALAPGFPSEPGEVSAATLYAVLDFVEKYAKPSALRVFGDAALPVAERDAALLARHIVSTSAKAVNARDVKRTSGLPTLRTAEAVDAAIEVLVEADWLRAAPARSGGTVGRQSKDYAVNPAVHRG